MIEPFIACICPAHARPDFQDRARRCFEAQTYKNKAFIFWNTKGVHKTVGAIRNEMISKIGPVDLIAHFDYDDWSAPRRLAEQVAFMQSTGASVVGYHDMPFYDEARNTVLLYQSHNEHYALGTSLLYKREVWENTPFPDQTPEDTTWQNLVGRENVRSCSTASWGHAQPAMVQTIHKGNACPKTGSRFEPAGADLEASVREIIASA